MNPFDNIEQAFVPFYDETVTVKMNSSESLLQQQLKCCVFSCQTEDACIDDVMDSDVDMLQFIFNKSDLKVVQRIKRGDTVVREDGQTFKVQDVKRDMLNGWIVTAKLISG